MTELERARAMLAETEELSAAGLGGPYAEQNLASARARVARLEMAAIPAAPPAPAPASSACPALVAASSIPPARRSVSLPQPTGTREERLRWLAKAMGADERALAHALASDTTPDAFAIEIMESRDPEAVARRIVNSDRPIASTVPADVEEQAQAILNA